ncbi:unnamed protein product [Caenorhabditis sp. 36 PRJEB53466]|nr:unnamed protein product [Caenorhabditis sp. 36 PRJEB53466]
MATNNSSRSSTPSTSTPPPTPAAAVVAAVKSTTQIDETELEQKLFRIYTQEVKACDKDGQSTQHIGDEWMRREIRKICGFNVSDRWIKLFRRKHNIRYFSGRRHADKTNKTIPLAVLDTTKVKTSNFLKERRTLRTSRKEYVEVDSRVNEEIVRRQTKGERLTNPWIREYAQCIASQMHPQMTDEEIRKFFDANWLYRFKRRYSVELKPRSPEEIQKPSPSLTNDSDESFSSVVCNDIKSEDVEELPDTSSYYNQMLQFHHYFNMMNQAVGGSAEEDKELNEQ